MIIWLFVGNVHFSVMGDVNLTNHDSGANGKGWGCESIAMRAWVRHGFFSYGQAGDGRNPDQSVTRTSQWDPQLMALLGEVASTCRKESNSGYVPKKKICQHADKYSKRCLQVTFSILFLTINQTYVSDLQENCSVQSVKRRNTRLQLVLKKTPVGLKFGCEVHILWLKKKRVFPEVSFPETWFCWPKWPGPNCGVFSRKTLEFGTMFWDTGKSQRCGNLTGTTLNASHSGSKRATPAVSGSPNCCNKRNMKHDLQTYISIINIRKIVHKRLCLKALESRISHFLIS